MLLNSNLFCYSSKYGYWISLSLRYQNTCADSEFFWGQMDIFASKGRWVQDQSSMTLPYQFNTVEFPVDLGMDLSFEPHGRECIPYSQNLGWSLIPCHDLGARITCKYEAYLTHNKFYNPCTDPEKSSNPLPQVGHLWQCSELQTHFFQVKLNVAAKVLERFFESSIEII